MLVASENKNSSKVFIVPLTNRNDADASDLVESSIPVPRTRSTFHRHAQRNAFHRCDARQQRRLFAPQNPWLGHSPSPTGLAEIVGDYIPLLCVDHIGVVCFPH